MKDKLWSDDKTDDDIMHYAKNDRDNVVYNLLQDIKCLKDDVITLEDYIDMIQRLKGNKKGA